MAAGLAQGTETAANGVRDLIRQPHISRSGRRHGVTALLHYVGEFDAPNFFVNGALVDTRDYRVDDAWRLDLQYELLTSRFGTFRLGCTNCTDEDPPDPNSLDTQRSSLHDKLGQAWYLRWSHTLRGS